MKTAAVQRAIELLEGRDILVSYSGGKDSMIVMDLARKFGARVEAFFMELVPGLPHMERRMKWAEDRWGVKIRRYPHWSRAYYKSEGFYCFPSEKILKLDLNDIYLLARHESGIEYLAMGAKRGDSLWRRRTAAMKFSKENIVAPIWDWSTRDVLAYLKANKLPIPEAGRKVKSGVDLTREDVLQLYDSERASYDALAKDFPFVGAIERRREWFEIG